MAQQNNSGQKIAFDKKKGVNVVIPADQFDRAMASGRFEIAPESKPTPMETVVQQQRATNPLGRVDNFYDLTNQQASTLRQQADDVIEQNKTYNAVGAGLRQQVDEMSAALPAKASAAYKMTADQDAAFRRDRPGLASLGDLRGGRTGILSTPDNTDPVTRNYSFAGNMIADTRKMIEQADRNRGGSSFAANLGYGIRDGVFDADTWDMGIREMGQNGAISTAVAKFDRGENLSDSERALLDATAVQLAAASYFGSDVGRGYKAGLTSAEAIPFMAEMALNPLSASGKGIAKKIAQYGVKRFASRGAKTAVKAASRIAGDVAAATGMAATTGLGDVAADTQRRMTGEHQFGINEQGRAEYAGHTEGESFGTAAAKSTAARAIENFSEMTGNYFGAAGGLLKGTKVAQSLGRSKVAKVLRGIGNSNVGRVVRNIEQRAQYQGVLGEDLEEQISTVLNAAIVGDQKFSDLTDASKQLDTFLGVAMMGGFLSSVQAGGYATQAWGAQRNLSRADAEGQKMFGEQWEELKNALHNDGKEESLQPFVAMLASPNYTREQKDAAMNYSQSLMRREGVVMGEQTASPELQQLRAAYESGEAASLLSPSQKQKIYDDYRNAAQNFVKKLGVIDIEEINIEEINNAEDAISYARRLDDEMYEHEKQADIEDPERAALWGKPERKTYHESDMRKYLSAKAAYEGLISATQSNIEDELKTAVDAVTANAHPDGNIYEAQTRDGRGGMIVSGDIVRDAAGNVDAAKSGDRVVIRREDGTTDMVPTSDIETIVSAEPAAAVQEQTAAAAREQAYAAAAQEIEGDPAQFEHQQEISVGGVRGVIDNPRNADGDVEVTFDDYVDIPGHGSRMAHFLSPETLRALSAPTTAAPSIAQEQSPAPAAQDQTAQAPAPAAPSEQGAPAQMPSQAVIEPEQVPAVEDIAPEASEAASAPAAPVFPSNKEGDIDFNAITEPADYAAALQQEFGAEAADTAAEMLADANADLATAKASKKGTAVDRRRAINKAAAEVARYQQVVDILNPTPVAQAAPASIAQTNPAPAPAAQTASASTPATPTRKSKKQTTPKQPRAPREPRETKIPTGQLIAQLGEPLSAEDAISRDFATKSVGLLRNDDGVRRGLKKELGLSENEINRRFPLTRSRAKGGISLARYAELLAERYGEIWGVDDIEVADTLRDLLLRFISPQAFESHLRAMHADIEAEQVAYADERAEFEQQADQEEFEQYQQALGEDNATNEELALIFAENPLPLQPNNATNGNDAQPRNGGISESEDERSNPRVAVDATVGGFTRATANNAVSETSRQQEQQTGGRTGIRDVGTDASGTTGSELQRSGISIAGEYRRGDQSEGVRGVGQGGTETELEEQNTTTGSKNRQISVGDMGAIDGVASGAPVGGTAGTSVSGLSGSEQRAGDQVAAQIDARIEELRAELGTARKRYAAEKSRVGQAYSQDNQTSLFGETAAVPADGALFDVPRDTTQGNISRILDPLLSDITRIENAISELNTSRDKAVSDAIEAERTQLKIADAEAATDTAPTEGQKQSGNYKKGHVTVQGFDITVENPRGSVRSGVAPDGRAWSQTMNNTYGYFKRTKGKDGDQIDVFLGDNPTSTAIFVVDQINPDGSFDEHKVMLGFDTEEQARAAYLANYEDGWQGLGNITEVGVEAFRRWLDNGTRKRKPFAEYAASPKPASNAQPTSGVRKIDDFGEKIGGARKDLAAEYRKTLSEITNSDIQNQPLSKTFPRPNYKALVESGALTQDNALYLSYLHDNIPTKPRNSRELRRWAPVVQMSIDEAQSVLEHNDVDYLAALSEKILQRQKRSTYYKANEPYTPSDEELLMLDDAWLRVETLRALGFPSEDVKLGDARIRFFIRDRNTFRLTIGKKYIGHFFSFDEAIDALRKKLDSPAKKTSTFNIYTNRYDKSIIFIGKPVQGKEPVQLTENFATVQEASNYLRDHRDELQIKWDAMSVTPEERRATNRERRGTDWRDGVDVTPEKFRDQFGFRGTEFGNWVNQKERQKALNDAYDGLMDLSQVLSVSPRALSLGGELAMAFGARGKGVAGGTVARAHYEPDKIVINITKTRGAGSLAHEWWHALDNYFSRKGGRTDEFLSDGSRQMNDQVRQEMKSAFDDLMKSISDSGLPARSARLDSQRSKSYWASRYEMSARAFENYVAEKIAANGGSNDYLVNFKGLDQWVLQGNFDVDSYPYPTADETPAINERFDQLFDAIEEKVDAESGNTILFRDGAESGDRAEIEARAKADGTWLKAPNGAKTYLTPEQWVTVRTQAFKNWFGDWESAPEDSSKVVDENGEPRVVAHSTDHEFTAFKNMQENDAGWLGAGYYFFGDRSLDGQYGQNIMQVFLNIREPYNIDYNEVKELSDRNKKAASKRFSSDLSSERYDGVYFNGNLNQEYVVFNPNQIKSATGNVGTFDAGSNDIRYRELNARFNDELRQQIEGTLPKGHIYSLGQPSEILLAAGIPNLPIEMAASRLSDKSMQENHPFDLAEVADLPQAVQNPLAVFRSATHVGSYVIMTELTHQGKNYVVAIETNRHVGRIDVNGIRSIHYRSSNAHMANWIEEGLLEYADKKRVAEWFSQQRYNSADVRKLFHHATKIVQDFQNPTIPAKIIEPTLDQEITSAVQDAARGLNVDVRIVEDAAEITDDNPDVQQRKRAAKGWFDTVTNQITIIAPNHTTPNDAVATLMHEAVGHYGLRQLLGADFNAFLRQVYNEGSTETRREIFRLSLGLGGNLDLAAEEYIAGLAEVGLRNPIAGATTAWARVRDAFRALLRRLGITVHFTDADLNYMLWKSYNRLREGDGIIDTARKIATDAELVRFREQEPLSLVQQQYEEKLGRTVRILPKWVPRGRGAEVNLFKLTEAYQDSMLAVKELMNVVLDSDDKPLRNGEDAYMAENHMSSKSGAETEVYMGNFFTPMMKSVAGLMSAGGMEYEDVLRYILAKHGLERNEVFAMRDAQRVMDERVKALDAERKQGLMEEGEYEERIKEFEDQRQIEFEENRAKDYSGLTSLFQEDTDEDGIDTATAEERATEIVAAVEAQNSVKVDSMWRAINDATKATLRKQFESGLLTKAQYGALQNMFKFYVPLRGWDEQTAADVWDYVLSERSSFNGGTKTAKGRRSVADDPISTIGNMAESAILQGNRNLMKQRFYKFALNHKTPLLSVTGQWYQNLGTPLHPLWEQSLPNIPDDATAEEIADAIEIHEEQMRTLEKDGMAKLGREGLTLPYRALTPEKNEHIVQGKTAGREWVVYVNGNPRAAQAINGTNVIKPQTQWGKNFARFNRQLSANFTTRNPAFVLGNMTRDMIFSSAAIYIKEDGAYTRRYAKNLAGNTKGLWGSMYRLNSGKLDPGNARDMYLQEFVMNGGETGHTALHSVDEYKKMVARKIVDQQGKVDLGRVFGFEAGRATTGNFAVVKTVEGLQAMGKGLSFMNRCAEDVSRLSVYMTSRQMGRTVEQSIADAKEVSVNFNKKGAGGMGASTFKALYLFFNAAVQSLANFTRLAKKSPPKFSAVIGGYMAMGALLPIVNAFLLDMIGDDDDVYNNLPDWIRRNNFCIPLSGGNFLTIPLPIELRAFYGMGEMFYQTAAGNMRHRNVPLEAVGQIADLMPLNVLGENGQVFTGDPKDLIGIFMPESAKPIWQVVVNKDFFGKPIFRDTDYNKQMPAYTKAYKGTNGFLVRSAELLNEVTGGDKYTQGAVNLNPATWEHVFEGYFGGTGKTINQAGKTISMIWNEDQRVTRNVPVVSRFVSSTDERNAFARVNEEYFKFLDEYTITQQQLRGYENEADLNVLEYAEKQNLLHNSPAYERYLIMHDAQKEIRELNKLIKETADKKERDVWEMELNLTKEQLVDELNAIEK